MKIRRIKFRLSFTQAVLTVARLYFFNIRIIGKIPSGRARNFLQMRFVRNKYGILITVFRRHTRGATRHTVRRLNGCRQYGVGKYRSFYLINV